MIEIEPMGNMPVIKDLIVDMDAVHWKKIQRVTPWLLAKQPVPEREYVVPRESMVDVTQSMACIQCGACVSDCLAMEVDPGFIGPAALAKAYRFVGDPRDDRQRERLVDLSEDPQGIFDCTHCFKCVEACPKDVNPMGQIMRLRRIAISDQHIVDANNGERHEAALTTLVRDYGLLHEAECCRAPTAGNSWFGKFHPAAGKELLSSLPTAVKAIRAGRSASKLALFGHKLPTADLQAVQRIYQTVEGRPERYELNLYISGEDEDDERRRRSARRGRGRCGRHTSGEVRRGAGRREHQLMKVAYWPGCVSRGFTPELHGSMARVAPLLDIELVQLDRANCTGCGVIAEHNQELADTLNARTFALAQQVQDAELMMNICSTCQGAQSECQERLDASAEYRAHVNPTLAPEGLSYERGPHQQELPVAARRGARPGRAALPRQAAAHQPEGRALLRLLHRAPPRAPGDRRRAPPRPLPRAGDRGARRHRDRVRRHAQVLRLPDRHDEQGGLAQAGRPPPRRRRRRRRRLPRDALPALPPQPRPPAARRRRRRRARAADAGPAPPPARRPRARLSSPRSLGLSRHVVRPTAVIDWSTSVVGAAA